MSQSPQTRLDALRLPSSEQDDGTEAVCRNLMGSCDADTADELASGFAIGHAAESKSATTLPDPEWNATDFDWKDDPTLACFVRRSAQRTPNSTAVVCGKESLSYAELDLRSDIIARHLVKHGVRRGEVVCVVADHTAQSILSIVAVLKAGAAYLPLDTQLPADRLAYFAETAQTRYCLGRRLPCEFVHTVELVNPEVITAVEGALNSEVELPVPDADSLAYVLFTSGSTGQPKGVMLGHRGPANTVQDVNHRFSITAADATLCLSALGFDLSVYDIFGMFAAGGTVVLPNREQSRNPLAWQQLVQAHQVTVWNTVPALMDILVTACENAHLLSSLRTVMLSGDWIPLSLPGRIRELLPDAEIWSLGGSTEASIWSVYHKIESVEATWKSIPYGRPLLNQRCYVVDESMCQTPRGEAGELCIAGVGVALGYINQPDRTAEQFVDNPFEGSGLLYKTGDLCRYTEDGVLEFLGRRDRQVKIRGYRIGLGEIESELAKQPGVSDAVLTIDSGDAGDRLIAYVRRTEENTGESAEGNLDVGELVRQLSKRLPAYMVPSEIIPLNAWPLTPNGKVDYKQLPLPSRRKTAGVLHADDLLGESEYHQWLSKTLAELLNTSTVDLNDTFFCVGGTSLTALTLIARIRQAFGAQLPYQQLLDRNRPLSWIADWLSNASEKASDANDSGRVASVEARPTSAPLSYQQQQMWVVNQIDHHGSRYNVPLGFAVHGEIDSAALTSAIDRIVARHEVLRTQYRFASNGSGELLQHVQPAVEGVLTVRHLQNGAGEALAKQSAVQKFVRQPFELSSENPFRAALFVGDDEEALLVLVFHHIAVDGHSIGIFNRELSEYYAAYTEGRECQLAIAPMQYLDYSLGQSREVSEGGTAHQIACEEYWLRKLDKMPAPVTLPSDFSQDVPLASVGKVFDFVIDGTRLEKLRKRATEQQTTPFVLLLSVLKILLHRYSNQDDIVVGTAVSTRDRAEIESTIGYFIGVLPIRTQLSPSTTIDEYCDLVHQATVEALSHQEFSYERMKSACDAAGAKQQDLFNVLFVLEDEQTPPTFGASQVTPKHLHTGTAKFDLLVAASQASDQIRIELEYDASQFAEARITQFARHFQTALDLLFGDPGVMATEIGLERQPAAWDTRHNDLPVSSQINQPSLVWRIKAIATRHSEQAAVCFAGRDYDYKELWAAADCVSGELEAAGVEAGDLVGLHLTRSPEMLAAVLGTIQIGGVCVPIDPVLPSERKRQIVECANVTSVLVNTPCQIQGVREIDVADAFGRTLPVPMIHEHLASDLIYVLFTSGSTGIPKGVEMPIGVIQNLVDWQLAGDSNWAQTRTLQFASLGFDVSFQEILTTLAGGGTLHLVDQATHRDLNALWDTIVQERIERVFLPFVALKGLCDIADQRGAKSHLREVITAGERLVISESVKRFFDANPQCRLINQYGPTESHVVTSYSLPDSPRNWPSLPPIGRPIQNAELAVVNDCGVPVPQGVQGELWIGQACIAKGYLGGHREANEKFVDRKLDGFESQRWYRSGDVCFINWDNQLEFVSRNDDQVKVRGNRVEPGEVEAWLLNQEQIREAAVVTDKQYHATHLIAFVQSKSLSQGATAAETLGRNLRQEMMNALPEYMVPAQIVVCETLPKTVNGKIDRQRLLNQHLCTAPPVETAVSPQEPATRTSDPLTASVSAIWKTVLRQDALVANSNFFDCGGNSLAAAIMFARLRVSLDIKVSMSILVANPTLQQFVRAVRPSESSAEATTGVIRLSSSPSNGERGPKPNIYCLPGIDGHFLNFRDLAAALEKDCNVFGLEPIGLLPGDDSPCSFEQLAEQQVARLLSAQPTGTYHIAGFSFGGVLAYEMAQQLWRAGCSVSLSMIDATPGVPLPASTLQSLAFHGKYLSTLPWREWLPYVQERIRAGRLAVLHRMGLISLHEKIRRIIDLDADYGRVAASNMQALVDYCPQASLGPATLYRAQIRASGGSGGDATAGWSEYFADNELTVLEVPGAHANMLAKTQVSRLANLLRASLAKRS